MREFSTLEITFFYETGKKLNMARANFQEIRL